MKVSAEASRRFLVARHFLAPARYAMRDALRTYLRFADTDALDWAPHLSAEKRLFLTRP